MPWEYSFGFIVFVTKVNWFFPVPNEANGSAARGERLSPPNLRAVGG